MKEVISKEKVTISKDYLIIRKNGEVLNLRNKIGTIVKKHWSKTYIEFDEGIFPILNTAIKKET